MEATTARTSTSEEGTASSTEEGTSDQAGSAKAA